jgi:hypothetical protein
MKGKKLNICLQRDKEKILQRKLGKKKMMRKLKNANNEFLA